MMNRSLQIAVEVFVRIEFRGVRRQIEDLDLSGMLFKPIAHAATLVHVEIVEDQKRPRIACG